MFMSFHYLHMFRPNEHSEDFHIRKPNDEIFLFKIEDKKYIHVGEKLFSFETKDEIKNYISEHGFNDVKFPFAHGQENFYFMLHQKYIFFKNMKIRQRKTSISICIKKMKS